MKKKPNSLKLISFIICLVAMVGLGVYFRKEIPNALRTGMDKYMEAEQIRLEARMSVWK